LHHVGPFGSAINLNLHLHSAIADGVFVRTDEPARPVFRALPAPDKGDVLALAWEICETTTKTLQRLGRYFDADPTETDTLMRDNPLLAACYAASLQLQVTMGRRAGQGLMRMADYGEGEGGDEGDQVHGPAHGFNLHPGMRAAATDRKAREQILHYILRPPFATKRLTRSNDGNVIYWLRQPWKDGTKCFIFDPLDFVAKLLPLIPPPRVNQIRYHGAWAPHAAIRSQVVPRQEAGPHNHAHGQLRLRFPQGPNGRKTPRSAHATARAAGARRDCRGGGEYQGTRRKGKLSWRELSSRTFETDVMRCVGCGHSPIQVLGVVHNPTSWAAGEVRRRSFPPKRSGRASGRPFRARGPPGSWSQLELWLG
jgi:hypothetical protein